MKLITKRFLLIITASLLTILASCNCTKESSTEKNTQESLKNNPIQTYKITELNGKKSLAVNPSVTLDFQKNTVSGNTGCNQFGGTILVEGNTIKFNGLKTTKMYCAKNRTIEKLFLTALSKSDSFKINDTTLTLFDTKSILLCTGIAKKE